MIKYNPTSQHYQINLAHISILDTHENPIRQFSVKKLCIIPGNNIINKICYSDSYLDNSDHYHHIIFEEKKMDHILDNIFRNRQKIPYICFNKYNPFFI